MKGTGPAPFQGVQTLTQACGGPSGGATGAFDDPNTDQPFRAPTWADLPPGEVRFAGAAAKVIAPSVSDQAGAAFDPIGGGGACATAPGADQAGTASYRLAAGPGRRLHADGLADDRRRHQLARPDLAARGAAARRRARQATRRSSPAASTGPRSTPAPRRPARSSSSTRTAGSSTPATSPKLELLPADQPYGRNSNGQATVTVSNLELRLPVLEQPGALSGSC